jgi:hypothetical protein
MNNYLKYPLKTLLIIQNNITNNKNNKNKDKNSIYLLNKKSRKKLDLISWAIYSKTKK